MIKVSMASTITVVSLQYIEHPWLQSLTLSSHIQCHQCTKGKAFLKSIEALLHFPPKLRKYVEFSESLGIHRATLQFAKRLWDNRVQNITVQEKNGLCDGCLKSYRLLIGRVAGKSMKIDYFTKMNRNWTWSSPRLDYRSWLLLRELVLLTTVNNTARLLSAHNFIESLQKTLEWLQKHANEVIEWRSPLREDAFTIADSSSTTIDDSSIKTITRSRKRKRDDFQSVLQNRPTISISNLEMLFFSISSVLIQLQKLTINPPAGRQGFVVEHLKCALKGSPDQTASILRNSILLADSILEIRDGDLVEDKFRVVKICLSSIHNIWESHSMLNDDSTGYQSNVIGLLLLSTCCNWFLPHSKCFHILV